MDTINTMFAIDCAASGLAFFCIGGIARYHFANRKLQRELDAAFDALDEEQTEGAHFRELTDDALANIEIKDEQIRLLKIDVGNAQDLIAGWERLYLKAFDDLAAMTDDRNKWRKRFMGRIAIDGNKSSKRKKADRPLSLVA